MNLKLFAVALALLLPSCGSVTDPTFMNNASASQNGGVVEFGDGTRAFVPPAPKPTQHLFFGQP